MELGTGMQNKLLQAMAMGLPCVTTPLAVDALGLPEGVMKVGTNSESLARCVVGLFDQPEEADRLGRLGREIVLSDFQWESTGDTLESVLKQAVAASPHFSPVFEAKGAKRNEIR